MTLPGSSETIGSGGVIATHSVDGKEYQVVMLAGPSGHLNDTQETHYSWTTFAAGAANQRLQDLFNASGSGVLIKVRKLFIQCDMSAITGVGHRFDVIRTSAVGTGGTAITFQKADTANANLPAGVTARARATGGATEGGTMFSIGVDPEETRPGAALMGMVNWLPEGECLQEIVLREGEGVLVKQITSNTAALWGCLIVFTVH